MDHGSTEWKDGLLELTLAMNSQIGCAPAKLLFRDWNSHIDWLNSQARKDLSIGVKQEDPTMGPIFESDLLSELDESQSSKLSSGPEPEPEPEPELELELELQLKLEPGLERELQLSACTSARRCITRKEIYGQGHPHGRSTEYCAPYKTKKDYYRHERLMREAENLD
ncbi:hypothetical protein VE03_10643 [Pseudogymnoascus sp. 23342-1-I1]|nr:hypothetical protein VE03_10643 [Pseudogymnoascus sp. 23342-1-I1]